jgi:hypothetical protein
VVRGAIIILDLVDPGHAVVEVREALIDLLGFGCGDLRH